MEQVEVLEQKEVKYFEVEMTLAELAKTYFHIDNFNSDEDVTIPVDDLGILIESYDINKKEKCFKLLDSFIIKPTVMEYYTDGILNGTSEHRIIEDDIEVSLKNHSEFKKINKQMEVVDVSVKETENYFANGRLNHNTTPGGNAVKFAASVRIKLQGKTPVVEADPFAQAEYERTILAWNADVVAWKSTGSLGAKPEKPKKEKGDEIIVGYDVTARTDKNKVGPPRREAEFRIVFSQGIIEEEAWFDYSLKYNMIKKISGFEYEFVKHPELGKFKRAGWLEMLSDVELHETVRQTIVEKLVRSVTLDSTVITDEEEEVETPEVEQD